MAKHTVGYYDTEQEAIAAIEDLKRQGYRSEDISIISKSKTDIDHVSTETGADVAGGAAAGLAAGGALGGIGGILLGLGALAIPGVGPIVAAGPIATGLTGLAAGGSIGGLAGAFVGMGISAEEADRYDEEFKAGKILVIVDEDTRGPQL
ncbi:MULTISPECIES: general stress protein [Solibacillus]|uniref:General stress protein n=1 Tax=Solibacillus merdavium TaxID=2762218 RepID=A0ABR8XQY9_9BACL|nr:general stress protein [Solibacillus merdavium]MBD8034364.1 general stress protein [Solibacillus merdavium]